MVERKLLQEQIAYYRAHAPAYRHISLRAGGPLAVARQKLLEIGHLPSILELASGTGEWTRELVEIGGTVTVVDASPEMIAINKQRVGHPGIEYQQADLFPFSTKCDVRFALVGTSSLSINATICPIIRCRSGRAQWRCGKRRMAARSGW